jgi:Sulfotransferase domain
MKPLALWCHPRARSTAMGRMMFERRDHLVLDEPFARPYYFSDERASSRRTDVAPDWQHRFERTCETILTRAADQPVFVKDHAYHVIDRVTPDFLGLFRNAFLVRHPSQALPSLFARMPDATLQETGYAELAQMVGAVRELGEWPILIDAQDLVDAPHATVAAWCKQTGIAFMPEALNWVEGTPSDFDVYWWGDPSWHRHLTRSTGFAAQSDCGYPALDDIPGLRRAYEACLPHYEELQQYRLRPLPPLLREANGPNHATAPGW